MSPLRKVNRGCFSVRFSLALKGNELKISLPLGLGKS
jgi:hypothetical protein